MLENKIYIGLGANQGNRDRNLRTALKEIENFAKITTRSRIYETEPVGHTDQNDFLNMVIAIKTDLSPIDLIVRLQEIEHKMGRVREITDGPRIIDLDILLYNNEIINQPNLVIPHPRMHKRNFILTPLREIAPELRHPEFKKTINTLHKNLINPKKVDIWT